MATIEEKARAYDEAIEKLRQFYRDYDTVSCLIDVKEELANLFPELAESEDERIRKAIIMFFELQDDNTTYSFIPKKDILAWLEKQCENAYNKELSELLHKVICRFINDPDIPYSDREKVSMKVLPYVERLEKQGEKNHAETEKETNGNEREIPFIEPPLTIKHAREVMGIKQDDAWGEEDETKLITAQTFIRNTSLIGNDGIKEATIDWLKSLKERVQPKQEWSEEDKCMLNNVINTLKPLSQTTHSGYAINSMIDWLKSLRPQSQWRPSDEQLRVVARLRHCLLEDVRDNDVVILDNLLEQLKAL